jgi:hypothetical protein
MKNTQDAFLNKPSSGTLKVERFESQISVLSYVVQVLQTLQGNLSSANSSGEPEFCKLFWGIEFCKPFWGT